MSKAFTLIEFLVVVIIITVLTAVAVPYYQNAVQSARNSEAMIWWGQVKRAGSIKTMDASRASRWEKSANGRLKNFTLQIVCRDKAEDSQEPCWEAKLSLKDSNPSINYFLTSHQNFSELVCVPLNRAGINFCQILSGNEDSADALIDGQEGYILHN